MKTLLNNDTYYMSEDKRILVEVKRVNNDVWGNPLYKVTPVNFIARDRFKTAYRNMIYNGYYLLQSYNIVDDLIHLFNEMLENEKYKNMPIFDNTHLESYRVLKPYY